MSFFYRAYIRSAGNSIRGAAGDTSPRLNDELYFNPNSGVIIHFHPNGTKTAYHIAAIPGDAFIINFFDSKYPEASQVKSMDELFPPRPVTIPAPAPTAALGPVASKPAEEVKTAPIMPQPTQHQNQKHKGKR